MELPTGRNYYTETSSSDQLIKITPWNSVGVSELLSESAQVAETNIHELNQIWDQHFKVAVTQAAKAEVSPSDSHLTPPSHAPPVPFKIIHPSHPAPIDTSDAPALDPALGTHEMGRTWAREMHGHPVAIGEPLLNSDGTERQLSFEDAKKACLDLNSEEKRAEVEAAFSDRSGAKLNVTFATDSDTMNLNVQIRPGESQPSSDPKRDCVSWLRFGIALPLHLEF